MRPQTRRGDKLNDKTDTFFKHKIESIKYNGSQDKKKERYRWKKVTGNTGNFTETSMININGI